MARTAKRLASGTLGTTNATLYTVPVGATTTVISIVLANKTATDATATIKFNAINIVPAKDIPANDAIVIPLKDAPCLLSATELIEGLSGTTASIDYYINGVEEA